MDFKEIEHVTYPKQILHNVICQVRYPQQLSTNKLIDEFQEKIKNDYPAYSRIVRQVPIGSDDDKLPVGTELSQSLSETTAWSHQFENADSTYRVSITDTFLALTCYDYTSWADFSSKLTTILEKWNEVFRVVLIDRVGLRYIDTIIKKDVGCEDWHWDQIITAQFLGPLANSAIERDQILVFRSKVEYPLDKHMGILRFNGGLGAYTKNDTDEKGDCFILDTDAFSLERFSFSSEELFSRLKFFHDQTYNFFRTVITEDFHLLLSKK